MNISKASKKQLKKPVIIPDDQIDYSEIPATDEKFWKDAKLVIPQAKHSVHLRLDSDIYEWFKSQGKRYQTHINAVLKTYVRAHAAK